MRAEKHDAEWSAAVKIFIPPFTVEKWIEGLAARMDAIDDRQHLPHALPARLVARYASAEKEVARLRQENAALRRQARPRASAAALRRIAQEAERTARVRDGAGLAIEPWASSLRFDCILSELIRMRMNEAREQSSEGLMSSQRQPLMRAATKCSTLPVAAAELVADRGTDRPFLEALGATTPDVIVELVRELPIAELLADALLDGAAALTAASSGAGEAGAG